MRRTRSLGFVADLLPVDISNRRQYDHQRPHRHHHHHQQHLQHPRHYDECGAMSATMTSSSCVAGDQMMTTSAGKCSSVGDLLTSSGGTLCEDGGHDSTVVVGGVGMDDFDSSWCSVDNLETDCVSPRVSTNSLFSQLDVAMAAPGGGNSSTWDEPSQDFLAAPGASHHGATSSSPDPTGARCIDLGVPDHRHCCPVYYSKPANRRRELLPVDPEASRYGQLHQHHQVSPLLYRQHTHGCRGTTGVGPPTYGVLGCNRYTITTSRSVSCPSIITRFKNERKQHQQPEDVPDAPSTDGKHQLQHSGSQERRESRSADIDKTSTSLQPHAAAGSSSARSSRSASPLPRAALGSSTRSPRNSMASSTGGIADSSTWRCRRTTSGGKTSSSAGGDDSAGHATGNGSCQRVNRSLAQTKCLQWLNSFDEDD